MASSVEENARILECSRLLSMYSLLSSSLKRRSVSLSTSSFISSASFLFPMNTRIAWLSGPCSAWERRSVAIYKGLAELSARTITSLGPASMSIETVRLASIFAKETNLLPGPKILFLLSTLSVPYVNAAIA